MRVAVIGGTGLVGALLLDGLSGATGIEVHSLQRRAGVPRPGITTVSAEPAEWAERIAALRPDALLSALGTTIRAAGSRAAFRAVDHDLLLGVARAARDGGARHMAAVSSVGASPGAANFYLRTKGEAEEGLRALAFPRLDILRPGLLTGTRGGPARPGEALAMRLAPLTDHLLHGGLRRYRSIPAASVASAMAALALDGGDTGTAVHEHDDILALAAQR